ncbi:recombinase family protein [Rhodobacter sp. KR11]|uniref:recombinase family protein n=1 Tax=Rhodobacter sp. KR11 TaxID=2974588 RepID=UPI002221EA1A|nr:recombinase family protein [Rhodobacter sp. KR11]MCW1920858.1 recombinase family protein [Rhodobacter sp. KR11]
MRAAIYAQFSSQMQREASIEDQVRLCRERITREGLDEGPIFSDRGISGASMARPGLQDLLAAAQAGRFKVLVCEALDRLSRDQADVATIYKRLTFAGVAIVTLAEGEITELHVGLKGTMNQLFLKDLADKTRRGLRGRVEAGMSGGGNSYGYNVVRRMNADGSVSTGEREINADEADVIRRIFKDFARGVSPKAIAKALNAESVLGPRGELWRDTAIRGHRQRGTGFLNNELYIGRLVWNRLRYVKDPMTGRRVSRINASNEWVTSEVPELRIVDDALWEAVKTRQGEIDADPRVKAIKATKFWEEKRPVHLLTGLLVCGCCGGSFATVGRDYMACSAARKLNTCTQTKSVRRAPLEEAVFTMLRDRLMQPDAVAEFVAAYTREINNARGEEQAERTKIEAERKAVARKLEGLYDAIAEGLRTPWAQGAVGRAGRPPQGAGCGLGGPCPVACAVSPGIGGGLSQAGCRVGRSAQGSRAAGRGLGDHPRLDHACDGDSEGGWRSPGHGRHSVCLDRAGPRSEWGQCQKPPEGGFVWVFY